MATQTCLECDFPGGGNCSVCHGKGTILGDEMSLANPLAAQKPCPACSGSGECQKCGGLGEIEVGGEG